MLVFCSLLLCCGAAVIAQPQRQEVSNILEALGYEPSCVATALATCNSEEYQLLNAVTLLFLNGALQKFTTGRVEIPQTCSDLFVLGNRVSGVQTVYPHSCCPNKQVKVFCDQTTDGGGWTVIQRRDALPEREDFYRTWVEYALGFGNLTGEFWLGLENIHLLVSTSLMELRIDLEDYEGISYWAKYGAFHVGNADTKYTLTVERYSGNAGDALKEHSGRGFSTHDQDNDDSGGSCARKYKGAWWYRNCYYANLNGLPRVGKHSSDAEIVNWRPTGVIRYLLKRTTMSFRPAFIQS